MSNYIILKINYGTSSILSTVPPPVHPWHATFLFLCSRKLCVNDWEIGAQEETMRLLYKIVMQNVIRFSGEEEAICDNTFSQLEKIKNCIQNDSTGYLDKALLYVENTFVYLNKKERSSWSCNLLWPNSWYFNENLLIASANFVLEYIYVNKKLKSLNRP